MSNPIEKSERLRDHIIFDINNSKHSSNTDLQWAIGRIRRKLQFLGLWRTKSENRTSEILSDTRFAFVITIITLACLLPGFIALGKVWGNLMLMVDNLNFTLSIFATVIKLIILWVKREVFAAMNDMIVFDWLKKKTNREINVMKKWAKIPRQISTGSTVLIFLTMAMVVIFPWLGFSTRVKTHMENIDDRLPMQSYFFYDTTNISHFALTYFMQVIALFMICLSFTAIDNYLALLVFHVCGQLQNLNERLLNLNELKNFKYAIGYCVQEHIRLLRSIETIDNSFTYMLLMFVLYLAVLFCFQGFIVVSEIDSGNFAIGRTLLVICAIVVTLGHFCVVCIVGEILVIQCDLVYYTSYDYEWYELQPQNAKCLIFLMIRASKPIYITAGKLFPMTMATFCSLLKTSAGYISVLLAVQN